MEKLSIKSWFSALFLLLTVSVFSQTATVDKDKILDKSNYPTFKQDENTVSRINKIYYEDYKPEYASWQMVEGITPAEDTLDMITKTYANYWKVYKEEYAKECDMEYNHKEAVKRVGKYKAAYKNWGMSKEYPSRAKLALAEALEMAQAKSQVLDNIPNYEPKMVQNDFKFRWDYEYAKADKARIYIAGMKLARGKEDPDYLEVEKKQKDVLSKMAVLEEAFYNKIAEMNKKYLETVKMPVENYKGVDKEQLRKKVLAAITPCDKYKVAKVFFPDAAWESDKGTKYDDWDKTYRKYDYQTLNMSIVLYDPKKPDIGYIINDLSIVKDKLKNTMDCTINKDYSCPSNAMNVYRSQMILMKNVK